LPKSKTSKHTATNFTYYLRRMLAADVSKYDPDPMRALASAYEFC